MEKFLAEANVLKSAIAPQDINGAGATGERFDMSKSARCAVVINLGASTGADLDVTLRQHDAASAGNSKDLEVANAYYHKVGAALSFTKVDVEVAAAAYDLASINDDAGIVVFEVLASNLDVNGGFNHFSIDVNSPGAVAKIVSGIYHGHQPFKQSAHEVEA